jgi:anti-sigma factor RsiW
MMHCTMDDLLALKDNEGSAWAKQHLETCPACRAELEALYQRIAQLRALPARRPARDRWPAVLEEIRADRHRRRRRWGVWSLAAAAGVAALVVLRPLQPESVHAELAAVKQQSATLEEELERYDLDGRVTSGRSAALAAALEDRIAVLDGELARLGDRAARTGAAELVNLWQQRVDLMEQLMSVRLTRADYVGL